MVSWPLLWEHFAALVLLWGVIALPGLALLPFLPDRIGFAALAPLGVIYWTVALYVLPFAGGLDIAFALALVLASISLVRSWPIVVGTLRVPSLGCVILVVGSLPYLSTLAFHYVPFGMDGSMHSTGATLIGRAGGLPVDHSPFLSDLPVPPMNLGLPAVAGVAMRWGGEPAAVMLATHHLTFTVLILCSYVLLRSWIAPTPSAVLAVASVWMARGTQASLEWGGYPTVLSVAIGLFAARLIFEQWYAFDWKLAATSGTAVATIPLIHGVGGGTWLYCVGPWIAVAAFVQTTDKWAYLRNLALTGASAAIVLAAYRCAGKLEVTAEHLAWTHDWQLQSAQLGDNIWLGAVDYVRKDAGSVIVLAGWASLGVLALRRQWLSTGMLAASWMMLFVVVANSHDWFLPGSFLLYPERAIYWAAPLSAVGIALVWRSFFEPEAPARESSPTLAGASGSAKWVALACSLLVVAGYFHNQFYQKIVRQDFVNADGWEALVWARDHLNSECDFVQASYNATGSFLPPIAQIASTGAHQHHFLNRQVQAAYARRKATHVLIDQALAPQTELPAGEVVFRNRTITIIQLGRGPSVRAN